MMSTNLLFHRRISGIAGRLRKQPEFPHAEVPPECGVHVERLSVIAVDFLRKPLMKIGDEEEELQPVVVFVD